ncbi:hypothetical protein GGX14DRAFT_602192 [Mycena pura]|uniref:F-box domain-containing protein n=1 Tax=Mycena pura TaxID=153505 RepID=A0AAD6VNK8_9AGAR|nr:hypothetical protein GGX14DRAFT_602192 [Mycena pura]
MAALEAQMTSLRAQKKQVLNDLKSHNLKSPVLTVPNEVTIEIFLHVVSLMRKEWQPYSGHSLLKLGSVCQTWRAVTLSTRTLWNNRVKIYCDCIGDAAKLLELCLPRAGGLPLDLDIGLPTDPSSADTIMSTLCQYGSQWQHIHLSQPGRTAWTPRLNFTIDCFPKSLPVLESFSLSKLPVDIFISSLRQAPQLRELILQTCSEAILDLPVNWLTTLVLFDFSIPQLLVLLPYALNLEYLELGPAVEDEQGQKAATPFILLPRLRTFRCNNDLTAMVLQRLTLPALERLWLEELSDAGINAIQSCVAQSNSTIGTLYVDGLRAEYNCLRGFSTIRRVFPAGGCLKHWIASPPL